MEIWFLLLLFAVAFLYASIGHGGASGYLALMVLFGVAAAEMKSSALLLNLFVSGIAFYQFYRGGHFRWKLFYPFAIVSIPLAFLGAQISIDPFWYKKILAVCLILAIMRILGIFSKEKKEIRNVSIIFALSIGGVIGLLSGMIGIGGGIILSPLILLMGWGTLKETAAVSALFIFVNSFSGLSGLVAQGISFHSQMFVMVIVALLGGTLGAYFGSFRFNNLFVKNSLTFVLAVAIIKLFIS